MVAFNSPAQSSSSLRSPWVTFLKPARRTRSDRLGCLNIRRREHRPHNLEEALCRKRAKADFLVDTGVPLEDSVFGPGSGVAQAAPAADIKALQAKIGELTLENDFLEGALSKAGLLSAKR